MTLVDLPLVRKVLASSTVDALTAPHGIDRYLELVDPRWSINEVRGHVVRVRHPTPSTVTFDVAVNAAWQGHVAGQFTRLGVEIDGVVHTRCYSMTSGASPAGPTTIQLTVGEQAGGVVSTHLVRSLVPGTVVRLSPASGDFTLPTPVPRRLMLLSAGTGITPMIAIVRTLAASGSFDDLDVTFVAYAATRRELLFAEELDRLAAEHAWLHVVHGFTEVTDPDHTDLLGLFAPAHLVDADAAWREAELFACGPTPFMHAVIDHATEAGRADHVHTEAFAPVGRPRDAQTTGGVVTFAAAQRTGISDGASILETAEGAGLQPLHGCRMGICHTCTRTKTSGCVRDLRTGELSGTGTESIQICVNAPVGDVVVDL
jgi:ferredoxin-NADP reductase